MKNNNYGVQQLGGFATITDSEITDQSYGVVVVGGSAAIHNSNIHGNVQYGVLNYSSNVVDASNNYWGAPDGPKHPIDPFDLTQGSGDQVSANVSFKPFQVIYGIPQGCTVNCNSNVLFLPGVAGSRLYEVSELDSERCGSDTGSSYFKRWLPFTDCDNSKLLLNVDGTSIKHMVTKDVIDEAGGHLNICQK